MRGEAEGVLLAQQPAVGVVLVRTMPVRPVIVIGEHLGREGVSQLGPAETEAHRTDRAWSCARQAPTPITGQHVLMRPVGGKVQACQQHGTSDPTVTVAVGGLGPEDGEEVGCARVGRGGPGRPTGRVVWDPGGHPRASFSMPRGWDEAQGSAR